jgi:hypothetical protein
VKILKRGTARFWKIAGPLLIFSVVLAGAAWGAITGATKQNLLSWVNADIFRAEWNGTNDSIYPGNQSTDAPTGNNVTFSGEEANFVAGGQGQFVPVSHNTVTIDESSTQINSAVIGAITSTGSATDNDVYIKSGTFGNTGNTLFPGQVYGGYVTSGIGSAGNNSVTISGGTINNHVVGGFVQGPIPSTWNPAWSTAGRGGASNNAVTVSGGTLNGFIYGGRANIGNAAGNTVSISGTMTYTGDEIIGGSSVSGDATGNSVSIAANLTGETPSADIIGGRTRTKDKAADNNTVTISSTVNNARYIFGGSAVSKASGNRVNLNGASIAASDGGVHIYGGRTIGAGAGAKGISSI